MDLEAPSTEGTSNDFAKSSSSLDPPFRVQRNIAARSCITCHQRKIRCDKKSPCLNCVRADVLCCYPTPQQNRARPHRTTIADVAARVARLERTVKAIENSTSSAPSPTQPDGSYPMSTDDDDGQESRVEGSSPSRELLVQDGSKSQYFNEFILSRVLAEEEELRSIIGSCNTNEDQLQYPPPFNITGILLGSSDVTANPQAYQPSQWQALQLWQAFINNVDPVLKILHIPTVQGDIYRAINTTTNVPEDLKTLLFSVYFAATTSLSSTDAANLLGLPKASALENYKRGFEHSLHRSDIFEAPNMRTLQALVIYITCLRTFNCIRAAWALNGLIHRLAKSIGLHRDGKNFGLSPFESEMRRRLWYRILDLDVRASEDLGISIAEFDTSSDTALPININDNQISPNTVSLPTAEANWTEMTLPLIYAHDPAIANEETLESACAILEGIIEMLSDNLLRGFRWHSGAYVQYHILTYVLWHLCIKPDSPNSTRAFQLVEDTLQLFDHGHNNSTRWRMMLQLRAKAIRLREAVSSRETDGVGTPSADQALACGAEEIGDISNWELNNYNDTFGWENIVDEFYTQI
ncbi:hypothetical protein B7463_g94, partial [Scytalidium lignicola]